MVASGSSRPSARRRPGQVREDRAHGVAPGDAELVAFADLVEASPAVGFLQKFELSAERVVELLS